jgi:hypothetical protein
MDGGVREARRPSAWLPLSDFLVLSFQHLVEYVVGGNLGEPIEPAG